jgi:hypothetical protein
LVQEDGGEGEREAGGVGFSRKDGCYKLQLSIARIDTCMCLSSISLQALRDK